MNFLGIDLGTSSVKVMAMDDQGNVLSSLSREYPVSYPRRGWAEQDPELWWHATAETIRNLLGRGDLPAESIGAIGFSGQMHGLVALDGSGKVLFPAILWCDQRTTEECNYINDQIGREKLSLYTGNRALTGFTAPKILWVKRHHPELYDRIEHILLPKDYIRYRLTGDLATDVSDASGTLLLDVKQRRWSQEMLDLLEISPWIMPELHESCSITGRITSSAATETGLRIGTPVVGGGGDQAAGAIGTGTVRSGTISTALGTSGVVFACQNSCSVDAENRLHSFCHANGRWHVMGVMLSAASCLKWWVDKIQPDTNDAYSRLLSEADKAPAGSSGLLFLPYLMGERTPYSDPNARGAFIGLGMTHDRGQMTRAILEGVCYGLRDSLEIIRELDIPVRSVRANGGGARSSLWRQMLADVFNTKVEIINTTEGPAYGAAIMAAVGAGAFSNVEEACDRLIRVTETTMPIKENVDLYDRGYSVYHKLYSDLQKRFEEMRQIEK